MRIALLYPPIADPTAGYLSLPYLATYLHMHGQHEAFIIDANVEFLHFVSQPERVSALLARTKPQLAVARSEPCSDTRTRRRLVDLVRGTKLAPDVPMQAIASMRDPQHFFQYEHYYQAASDLRAFLDLLSTDGVPGQFNDFSIAPDCDFNLSSFEHLTAPGMLDCLNTPLAEYLDEVLLPQLATERVGAVGIGVTYQQQLPYAICLAREIRRVLPQLKIILGGTAISQTWKFSNKTGGFAKLFAWVDACVIGEGESALQDLLSLYEIGSSPRSLNGVVTVVDDAGSWPRYENLDALPSPIYDEIPSSLYLSPDPFVYYAPTRGCYWDRCTFCSYGLSDNRPTSPWRERSVDLVVDDLKSIARKAKYVYFSVDSIAPAYLTKLARCIIDAGIDIRWGAEIRLERYLNRERCQLLRDSGCIGVSVGFESGSQRILNLMDKGTQVERTKVLIHDLTECGIAVQVMGFTGFPSESFAEAMESVSVLRDLREDWTFGGLGRFNLIADSIVAKQPERFGISSVWPSDTDDIHYLLKFEEITPAKTLQQEAELHREISTLRHSLELPRPFVGGIDSVHSYLYLDRFGTRVRNELDRPIANLGENDCLRLRGDVLGDAPEGFLSKTDGNQVGGTCALLLEDGPIVECPPIMRKLSKVLDGSRNLRDVFGENLPPKVKTAIAILNDARLLRRCGSV